jgi:hypothetical protein
MAISDLRLATMTFAQRWDGAALHATLLLLPSGDPTASLLGGTTAPFAGTPINLRAYALGGLAALPDLATAPGFALTLAPPAHAVELFTHLKTTLKPVDQTTSPVPARPAAIRKALPATYTALLPPGAVLSPNVSTADAFGCTVRGGDIAPINPGRPDPNWGQVLSYALRNRLLADALGLRYTFDVPADVAAAFGDAGGWLFVAPDTNDGGTGYAAAWAVNADLIKCYAARIPALAAGTARRVFSAVLFPVHNDGPVPHPSTGTPDEGAVDAAITEAELYDDGFAKLLHARQPDSLDAAVGDGKTQVHAAVDAGVQIGWDDEQVLAWHNRQLAISAAASAGAAPPVEAPLGVSGYRIDVRAPVAGETGAQRDLGWQSLMLADGTVPPELAGSVAEFSGELAIEPTASTASPTDRTFWLPLYFAQWRGLPLGTRDDTPHLLAGGSAAKAAGSTQLAPSRYTGKGAPPLLYGATYEFRTRLCDLSGGGPEVADLPLNATVADRARLTFSRYVPPKACRLAPAFDAPHVAPRVDRIVVTRPLIAYPEALFTPRYGSDPNIAAATRTALLAQLGLAPDGTPPAGGPPPANDVLATGVPDPDVTQIEIVVEVRALAYDLADDVSADGAFREVYRTTRPVPPLPAIPVAADGTVRLTDVVADAAIGALELDYVDVDDVATLAATAAGALPIPRSRDVRITVTPLGDGPPGYFGTLAAGDARPPLTRGITARLVVRAAALAESTPLFTPPPGLLPVEAHFFQPVTDGDPVFGAMSRLAAQLRLDFDGLTLRARPGERVVFGIARALKHTLSTDGGSVTFGASAELFHNWIVSLDYELARDWTWDGLTADAISVRSGGTEIGTIAVPRLATPESLAAAPGSPGPAPDRTETRVIFLDGIDPTIPNPADGFSNRPAYQLVATIAAESGTPFALVTPEAALTLPVAVAPARIPELASAGYALSAYAPLDDYSATQKRSRRLWLELKAAPADGDTLFARVLAYAPDPLLYVDAALRTARPGPEPELRLDPELMRTITPGQPRDENGSEAMLALTASPDDPRKFLLELPPGVAEDDPQLFGLWAYELRFGHVKPWSTAQARFGRPLRAGGVAHPAPALPVGASWTTISSRLEPPPQPHPLPPGPHPAPGPHPQLKPELSSGVALHPQPGASRANGAEKIAAVGGVIAPEQVVAPGTLVGGGSIAAAGGIVTFTTTEIIATAPYAQPVLAGRRVGDGFPRTIIGFLLYAQVMQADGSGFRNILIAQRTAQPIAVQLPYTHVDEGRAVFAQADVDAALAEYDLPAAAPLSILAVEFYAGITFDGNLREIGIPPRGTPPDAWPQPPNLFDAQNLGQRRILRTSALTPIAPTC